MTPRADGGRRTALACPHCGAAMRIRSSRLASQTCRELNLHCVNTHCGATYGATLEISHAISPSARPNPSVNLRQAPARPRHNAIHNSPINPSGPAVPPPANDDATRAISTG